MSLIEDIKFVGLVAHKLDRFKKLNAYTWNFRCPHCGDSKKKVSKTRGYLFKYQDSLFFNCFNCNFSCPFKGFLKMVDPTLLDDYNFEKYKHQNDSKEEPPEDMDIFKKKGGIKEKFLDLTGLDRISNLPDDHAAVLYLKKRMIPRKRFSRLYYVEDYTNWSNKRDQSHVGDSRIIIPFYDEERTPICVQGRLLMGGGEDAPKYLTKKFVDEGLGYFGLDDVDWENTVYLLEGPFDSMFVANSLAVAGSGLMSAFEKLQSKASDIVLIFDNEPRNKQICSSMVKAIDMDANILIWPEVDGVKDINDLVLKNKFDTTFIKSGLKNFLAENTHRGLHARMRFSEWCRISL